MSILEQALPFSALMRRELLTLLRRPGSMFGLAVILLLSIGGVWSLSDSPMMRSMSAIVFSVGLGWGYMLSVLLVSTVAGVSISAERQNDTLDFLLLTLARSRSIVLAKALTAFGFFLLLCVGLLPIFGVVFFYVGVDTGQFVQGALLVFATTFAHASLGVLGSASQRNSMRAIIRAIALTVLFSVGLFPVFIFALIAIAERQPSFVTASMSELGGVCVPYYRITQILTTGAAPWLSFAGTILYQLVVAALSLLLAVFSLQRNARRTPTADPAPKAPRGFGARRALWFSDRKNPIRVKELRQGSLTLSRIRFLPFLRTSHIVFFGFFSLAYIGLTLMEGQVLQFPMRSMAMAWGGMLSAIAPAVVCTSLMRERRSPTYVLLTTSLITPRQIVFGHTLAAIQGLVWLFVVGMLGVLALSLLGYVPEESLPEIVYITILSCAQFPILAAFGAIAGATFSTLPRALIFSYLLVFLYLAVPTLLANVLFYVFGRTEFSAYDYGRRGSGYAVFLNATQPVLSLIGIERGSTYEQCFPSLFVHLTVWIPITALGASMLDRLDRFGERMRALAANSRKAARDAT